MLRLLVLVSCVLLFGTSLLVTAAPPVHRPGPVRRPIIPRHAGGAEGGADEPAAPAESKAGGGGEREAEKKPEGGSGEEEEESASVDCEDSDASCAKVHTEQELFGYLFCGLWLLVAVYCCSRRCCKCMQYDSLGDGSGSSGHNKSLTGGETARLKSSGDTALPSSGGASTAEMDVLMSGIHHNIQHAQKWMVAMPGSGGETARRGSVPSALAPASNAPPAPLFPQTRTMWSGTFSGKPGGVNNGTHPSSMILEFRGGLIQGDGTDRWGAFHVDGSYHQPNGRFVITKIYPGHNTMYRGTWDGASLKGQWFVIKHEKNYAEEGTFELFPATLPPTPASHRGGARPITPTNTGGAGGGRFFSSNNRISPRHSELSVDTTRTAANGMASAHSNIAIQVMASPGDAAAPPIVFVSPAPKTPPGAAVATQPPATAAVAKSSNGTKSNESTPLLKPLPAAATKAVPAIGGAAAATGNGTNTSPPLPAYNRETDMV